MLLGTLLRNLRDERRAEATLAATGDLLLIAEVESLRTEFGESVGEYVSGAAQRFANTASDDDWLQLMTQLERAEDKASICVGVMVRWSLRKDRSCGTDTAAGCSHHRHEHAHGQHA